MFSMSRLLKIIFVFLICLFIARPAHALTNNSQLYLTDYLEFSVFPKLAPASYQDQLKNAMIMRASGQTSQTNYVCSAEETEKINQQGINWLPNLPPFAPADYSKFYLPFIKSGYPDNTHQDITKLPNSESVGCLIIYAQKFFNTLFGSHFIPEDIDRVINFAVSNNFNPSLFLAIWLEETHAGDRSPIEFGCGGTAGGIAGFDAQLNCLQNLHPLLKNTPLFHCFLCGYAGDCTANLSCGWTNTDQFLQDKWTAFIQYYNYLTRPGPTQTPTNSSGASTQPDAATITKLYGFTPATKEVHNYFVANWSGEKIYLKDFVNHWAPLPEDFGQNQDAYADAYETWKQSDGGKWYQLWPYVQMFTREDTKGFIEAPSGEVHEVKHPHISRTYEVSSALLFLAPFQPAVAPPVDNSLPTVANYLTGSGDVAQEGSFTTANPTESPVKFTTYTPFLKEISDNLIGIYSKNSGIFNIFNTGPAYPKDIHGLDKNSDSAAKSKFYYRFLGSDFKAKEYIQSVLQPFIGNY